MNLNEYIEQLNNTCDISNFFNYHNYLKFGNKSNLKAYYRNLHQYNFIFHKLLNLCLNLFKYDFKNNPFNFNSTMIEAGFIFQNGVSCFLCDSGIFILPARPSNILNVYGEPTKIIFTTANGKFLAPKNEINIINVLEKINILDKNNFNKGIYQKDFKSLYCLIFAISHYARKIADKEVALEILTQRLKSPFTIVCDKEEINSIKKYIDAINNNDELIIATKGQTLSKELEVVNNNFNPDLVMSMKQSILFDINEFIEFIGINTDPNPDKAERKLVDELNANNVLTSLQLKARLDSRKELCDKIKKVFDIDIDVKFNQDEINKNYNDLIKNYTTDTVKFYDDK